MRRLTLGGALFGLLFPLLGTLLECARLDRLSLLGALRVQAHTPLLWVLDAVPLVLVVSLLGTALLLLRLEDSAREQARAMAEIAANRDLFESSIKALHDGFLIQDAAGVILQCNPRAEEILGLSTDQMIGLTSIDPRWRAVREDGADFPGQEHPAMVSLREGVAQTGVVMGVHKPSGELTWISINTVPLFQPGETRPHAVVCTFADITARLQAEEALRRKEARLTEAQRVAKLGNWEYDLTSGEITWSEEMFRLYGLVPSDPIPTYDRLVAYLHPEDRPKRDRLFQQARTEGRAYEMDLRLLLPDGTTRWCHTVNQPILDGEGRTTRMVGAMMDITERAVSEERFRILFEESSDAHLLLGAEGIIDCNQAAVEMLCCTNKSHLLTFHPAVFSPEFQPDGRRSDEKCIEMDRLAREHGVHRFEWMHCKLDGHEFPVEVTLTPVVLNEQPVLLVVWHDLTERKAAEQQIKDYTVILEFQKGELERANAELAALATTDGLTGLKNHRTFQERLSEEYARAVRYGTPLSVVLLDVDKFKQYNDTFGHPQGDVVLRRVARLLEECMRETDLAARYGGEEFILLLPQADAGGAAVIAERVRAAIEAHAWPLRAVTASLGLATLGLDTDGPGTLIARADAALYEAKKAGRNRVASAGALPEPSPTDALPAPAGTV